MAGLIDVPKTARQDFLTKLKDACEFVGSSIDPICYRADVEPVDFMSDLDGTTTILTQVSLDLLKTKAVSLFTKQINKLQAKKTEVQALVVP